jgi:hypothetical protein
MKKNMIKVAFVAAIAMMSGVCFMNSQKSETLSEVALANVEALASVDDNWYCVGEYGICYVDYLGVILGHFHSIEPEN